MRGGKKKTDFALPGEAVDLLEAGSSDTAFEDAEILFCVYVEGFLVYVWVIDAGLVGVGGFDVVKVVEEVLYGGVAVGGVGGGRRVGGRVSVQGVGINFILGGAGCGLGLGWVLKVVLEVEMMISGGEQLIDRIAH